jgi:hypothetical protein
MPEIPDFSVGRWQSGRSDAQLAASILDGKGLSMPPWRGRVGAGQARDLVALVRSFGPSGSTRAEAPASEFTNRFRRLQKRWEELHRQAEDLSHR